MKKVLIVDDDVDLLSLIKATLKKNGFDVAVTTSCDEGENIFYSFKPDILLLDINVGTQDGRQMCKKIKAQAEYQHIPVILVSANFDMLEAYKEYGANTVVKKPFKLSAFLELIRTELGIK